MDVQKQIPPFAPGIVPSRLQIIQAIKKGQATLDTIESAKAYYPNIENWTTVKNWRKTWMRLDIGIWHGPLPKT